MTWGMVAVAGASLVGGVLSSQAAKKSGAKEANNAAANASNTQAAIASDQWNRYQTLYDPLERQMVADAQTYDNPNNYAKAAGLASATVAEQFNKQRQMLARTPGLDPSSAAYQAGMFDLGLKEAVASATQQNAARQGVTDTAYQRRIAALGLGKGLDQTAAAGFNSVAATNQNMAANANRQANAEAQGIGGAVGNLAATFGQYIKTPAPTPITTTFPTSTTTPTTTPTTGGGVNVGQGVFF